MWQVEKTRGFFVDMGKTFAASPEIPSVARDLYQLLRTPTCRIISCARNRRRPTNVEDYMDPSLRSGFQKKAVHLRSSAAELYRFFFTQPSIRSRALSRFSMELAMLRRR